MAADDDEVINEAYVFAMLRPDMSQEELVARASRLLRENIMQHATNDQAYIDEIGKHEPEALDLYPPETLLAFVKMATSRGKDGRLPSFLWAMLNPGLPPAFAVSIHDTLSRTQAQQFRGRMALYDNYVMGLFLALQFNVASAVWEIPVSYQTVEVFLYSTLDPWERTASFRQNFNSLRIAVLDAYRDSGDMGLAEFARLVRNHLNPDGSPKKDEDLVKRTAVRYKGKTLSSKNDDKKLWEFVLRSSFGYRMGDKSWIRALAEEYQRAADGTFVERLAKMMRLVRSVQVAVGVTPTDDLARKFFEI